MSTQQPNPAGHVTGPTGPTGSTGGPPATKPPEAPTGTAGGPSGSQTGVHYLYPSVPNHGTWDKTKEGANMADGYTTLHAAFTGALPLVRQSLQTLARRPIGG